VKKIVLFIVILYCSGCQNDNEKKVDTNKSIKCVTQLKDTLSLHDSVRVLKDSLSKCDSTITSKNEKLTYIQAYDKALTLWPIPFKEIYINTSFGKAHVIECGLASAEPLVLLHGMDASSTMWYPNIEELSKHYRVYAIDFFLEPGKSACYGEVKNTKQIILWYYEIFNSLNLKKFSLVGASRGGWLAVNIALHNPSRINKIALLSPAQTFSWIKPGPKILFNIAYSMFPKRKRFRSVLETMTFDIDKIKQAYINQYYLATQKGIMHKCFFQMTPFPEKELKTLKMPILVLIGDHDIINGDKSLKRAKKLLSNIQTAKIKNAGHFLSFDQPDVINKKLLIFLE